MAKRLSNVSSPFSWPLAFNLQHKATCRGGGCLTRHSHYARVGVVSAAWAAVGWSHVDACTLQAASRAGSPSPATRPVRALRRGVAPGGAGRLGHALVGCSPGWAARGVRADARRGHQREQSGMGWADAVGGKGRLIFLYSKTRPVARVLSPLRYTSAQNSSSRICVTVQGQVCGRAVAGSPVSSRALARV